MKPLQKLRVRLGTCKIDLSAFIFEWIFLFLDDKFIHLVRSKLLVIQLYDNINDNVYHEGNISKMPDFDVLTLSESHKRKSFIMVYGKRVMTNVNGALQ